MTNIKAEITKLVSNSYCDINSPTAVIVESAYLEKLESLVLELGEVCEALEFYADVGNADSEYSYLKKGSLDMDYDRGHEARQALAKLTAKLQNLGGVMKDPKVKNKFTVTRYYRETEDWELRQYKDGDVLLAVNGRLYNVDGVRELLYGFAKSLELMEKPHPKKATRHEK